ncbi:MAG: Ig-like domain-containing protein [Deltaproteobacteria bacterium]|nr:Ig-like domain-containing protein [Deltaproteobacteria bacterium]
MITILAMLVGCGQTPAAVTFDGAPSVTAHTTEPIAVQKAVVVDADKKPLADQPKDLKWTVTPDSVAKLDGTNVVPVGNGDAVVKACATETVCGEYTVKVSMPDDLEVTGVDGVEWKIGATAQLAAKVMAGEVEVTGQKVTWTSDAPAVATVDESGKVTAVTAGNATVTAQSGAISTPVTLTIVDPLTPAPMPTN